MFGSLGQITTAHLPFLAFIERAQAFCLGAIAMIESGNPLAAATLLRSFAENLTVVFYINAHPTEIEKLQPGARHGIKIGRIISQAEKRFPGFKGMYDELTAMAHPSGAGSYHTLKMGEDRALTWQPYPTFHDLEDARHFLELLDELSDLTTNVIKNTAREFEADGRTPAS